MDPETKTRLREWLVGTRCTSLSYENGIPFLRFGSFSLWIPSLWRATIELRIVASYDSDESSKEQARALLSGKEVQDVAVDGPFHDLTLHFETGIELDVLSDSSDYENWQVIGGPDKMIIAGPGSSWTEF